MEEISNICPKCGATMELQWIIDRTFRKCPFCNYEDCIRVNDPTIYVINEPRHVVHGDVVLGNKVTVGDVAPGSVVVIT